jgi:hypothetical protein
VKTLLLTNERAIESSMCQWRADGEGVEFLQPGLASEMWALGGKKGGGLAWLSFSGGYGSRTQV